MVLIGMATIFAVLCLLWGFLALFKVVFHDLPAKKAAKSNETVAVAPAAPVANTSTSDDEIIAVIAAAIAMAESECSDTKFKVVSFKRK
jgi:sodium pump decarboxylase gamma subunit